MSITPGTVLPRGVNENVLYAQAVQRLTKNFPVTVVALDVIPDVDTDYWFRYGPVLPTARRIVEHVRLIQEVDMSHPVILGADGRLMDGMHRVARALLDGATTISAIQFHVDPEPDYRDCRLEDLPYPDDPGGQIPTL
jgi:hypothetical protein